MRCHFAVLLLGVAVGGLSASAETPDAAATAAVRAPVEADAQPAAPPKADDAAITDADDQFWRGFNLLYGRGVPKDSVASTPWFRRAAEQGHLRAQVHMGMAYLNGRGVSIDRKQALEWLLLAAEQGHPKAQLEAGILLFDGRGGIERDRVEAVKWLLLALQAGSPMARAKVPVYLQAATKDQHRAGLERARAWRIERGLPVPEKRTPDESPSPDAE